MHWQLQNALKLQNCKNSKFFDTFHNLFQEDQEEKCFHSTEHFFGMYLVYKIHRRDLLV